MRFPINIEAAVRVIHISVRSLQGKDQPRFSRKISHVKALAHILQDGIKEHLALALRLNEPEAVVVRRILAHQPGHDMAICRQNNIFGSSLYHVGKLNSSFPVLR